MFTLCYIILSYAICRSVPLFLSDDSLTYINMDFVLVLYIPECVTDSNPMLHLEYNASGQQPDNSHGW